MVQRGYRFLGSSVRPSKRERCPGCVAISGFTLVELLVVISIIALLISILMPSLVKARHEALRIVCANNLRSLGQGCRVYAGSYRGQEPILNNTIAANGSWPMGYMIGGLTPGGRGVASEWPWGLGQWCPARYLLWGVFTVSAG
jgi:prepilin-type N-terminal cleavage/methylation domain-containing protein